MTEPLTQLERRVYRYLIDFLAENTFQPSIRDIAKKHHIKSTKTVSDLLHSLANKGYIERDESRSRGVRLLGVAAAGATQPVPCLSPARSIDSTAEPPYSGHMTMDRRFLPSDDVFFLRTSDEAMNARGILSGDYVLVSPSARAKDGDLVAARIGGHSRVRTLTHRGATIVLEAAEGGGTAIEVGPRDDFAILGVVCAVFRPFFEEEPAPPPADEEPD